MKGGSEGFILVDGGIEKELPGSFEIVLLL